MKRVKEILITPISYVMAVLAVLRVFISHALGVWFPAGQIWDDSLLMEYADLAGHFRNPNRSGLLKTMGYPMFLKAVSVSKLPYTVILGLLWVATALFVYFLVKRIDNKRRGIALGFYVYTLFMPQAFDFWSGTRLYRTGMIAPFVIVTLVLMIHVILDAKENDRNLVRDSIFLGIFFSYTYYIKEDGLWLMACLVFDIIVTLLFIIVKNKKAGARIISRTAVTLLPVLVWIVTTLGYKAINYRFYGVFDINTRTESEYGEFVEKVYKTESPNRSLLVWAPYDAIDAVFEASETLNAHPELLVAIHESVWAEDTPLGHVIPGDHFAFALREEMYNVGLYESEASVKKFFSKVNAEVDDAFKSGKLTKAEGRIQLLASTGGYTFEEIRSSVLPLIGESLKGAVLLKGYNLGIGYVSDWEIENLSQTISFAKNMSHIGYLDDYGDISVKSQKMAEILRPLLMVYKLINVILFVALLSAILLEIVIFFINIKSIKTFSKIRCRIILEALAAFVLLGVSVCYAFSISWFSAFCYESGLNMTILNFYNIALPGLLTLAYVFTSMIIKNEIVLVRNSKKGDWHHV